MSRRKVEDELTDVPHDCVSETTVVAQEVEVSTGGESAVEKRRQNLLLGDAYKSSSSGRARKRQAVPQRATETALASVYRLLRVVLTTGLCVGPRRSRLFISSSRARTRSHMDFAHCAKRSPRG